MRLYRLKLLILVDQILNQKANWLDYYSQWSTSFLDELHFISPDTKERIVVEFATVWCNRYKEVSPVIKTLASEHKLIKFFEIDADIEDVGEKYLINGVPTVIFFRAGMKMNRIEVSSCSKFVDIEKYIKHNSSVPDLDK